MKLLEERIRKDGQVRPGNILKVDSFLNHQLDVELLEQLGKAFYEEFKDKGITRILTIEASGIALACLAAQYFKVPVVFAKKRRVRISMENCILPRYTPLPMVKILPLHSPKSSCQKKIPYF